MTREEAISLLMQVNKILVNSNSWLENTHEPLNIAFDMAIKALEQEPIKKETITYLDGFADGLNMANNSTNKMLDKIRAEIADTLYVDSLIFGELIDFKNGKISADDVIEEFNRVTRMEILHIIDKYKTESEPQESDKWINFADDLIPIIDKAESEE